MERTGVPAGRGPAGTPVRSLVCLRSGRHFLSLIGRPRPGPRDTRTWAAGAGPHKGTGGYQPDTSTASRTRRAPWVVLGPVEELARQLVARQRVDLECRSGQLVGRRRIIVEFLAGFGSLGSFAFPSISKMGCLRTSQLSGVHCERLDVEKGCSGMEDDHRPSSRGTGYQGHELSGLNGAVIRGQGRLGPRGRVQTPPAESTFSVERGKDASLRQCTTRRLAQIEAASAAALVTMPTATWGTVLKEGARLSKQSETEPQYTLERQHGAR